MSLFTLFGGSYSNAEELAEKIARRLDFQRITEDEILDETSQKYEVDKERLARTLYGPPSFLKGSKKDRAQNIAYIRAILADRIRSDRIAYHGFAMHLLPRSITHILRVCVVADQDYKIRVAMEKEAITEKKARSLVKKDNGRQLAWVQYLSDRGPWDESLYDMVIPMHTHSVEGAADLVCANADKEVLATTPRSRKAMNDFLLAAQVYLSLATKFEEVEVSCDDGVVTMLINKFVVRYENLKEELTAHVSSVPGVKRVQARRGPKYKSPSIYRDYDFELPPKILLVDDEREFVETLSERLRTRELETTVAYSGEEALSQIEKDEPEVMVLDLKMPGVDGMEVLRRVKKERPNVEVIILTGHGSEKDKALAERLGAFAYLEKPVDISVLTDTMRQAYQTINEARAAQGKADGVG